MSVVVLQSLFVMLRLGRPAPGRAAPVGLAGPVWSVGPLEPVGSWLVGIPAGGGVPTESPFAC